MKIDIIEENVKGLMEKMLLELAAGDKGTIHSKFNRICSFKPEQTKLTQKGDSCLRKIGFYVFLVLFLL